MPNISTKIRWSAISPHVPNAAVLQEVFTIVRRLESFN
jgi:hypothetical protein